MGDTANEPTHKVVIEEVYKSLKEMTDLIHSAKKAAGDNRELSRMLDNIEFVHRSQLQNLINLSGLKESLWEKLIAAEVDYKRMLPKPRKTGRNPEIHRMRTEEGLTSWVKIRSRLQDMNPAWVTIKKTGKLAGPKALENGYKAWLMSQQKNQLG